jgi:hypothetical protein
MGTAQLQVSIEAVAHLLRDLLPDGAEGLRMYVEPDTQLLSFVFRHDDLHEIAEGAVPPYHSLNGGHDFLVRAEHVGPNPPRVWQGEGTEASTPENWTAEQAAEQWTARSQRNAERIREMIEEARNAGLITIRDGPAELGEVVVERAPGLDESMDEINTLPITAYFRPTFIEGKIMERLGFPELHRQEGSLLNPTYPDTVKYGTTMTLSDDMELSGLIATFDHCSRWFTQFMIRRQARPVQLPHLDPYHTRHGWLWIERMDSRARDTGGTEVQFAIWARFARRNESEPESTIDPEARRDNG